MWPNPLACDRSPSCLPWIRGTQLPHNHPSLNIHRTHSHLFRLSRRRLPGKMSGYWPIGRYRRVWGPRFQLRTGLRFRAVATPGLEEAEFLVGHCTFCDRQVLTHLDLDLADEEIRLCVHCDGVVSSELTWLGTRDLEAHGYSLMQARSCGNGGGCSAGGCGTRR